LGVESRDSNQLREARQTGFLLVPSFASKINVRQVRRARPPLRPNWKEQPPRPSLTGKEWR
jgi:hypothetical protein